MKSNNHSMLWLFTKFTLAWFVIAHIVVIGGDAVGFPRPIEYLSVVALIIFSGGYVVIDSLLSYGILKGMLLGGLLFASGAAICGGLPVGNENDFENMSSDFRGILDASSAGVGAVLKMTPTEFFDGLTRRFLNSDSAAAASRPLQRSSPQSSAEPSTNFDSNSVTKLQLMESRKTSRGWEIMARNVSSDTIQQFEYGIRCFNKDGKALAAPKAEQRMNELVRPDRTVIVPVANGECPAGTARASVWFKSTRP